MRVRHRAIKNGGRTGRGVELGTGWRSTVMQHIGFPEFLYKAESHAGQHGERIPPASG
jgi:hypothetical protein